MNLVADGNVDAAIVSALAKHARELPAAFAVIGPTSLRIRPGSVAER